LYLSYLKREEDKKRSPPMGFFFYYKEKNYSKLSEEREDKISENEAGDSKHEAENGNKYGC
jgi:hypothetical protein